MHRTSTRGGVGEKNEKPWHSSRTQSDRSRSWSDIQRCILERNLLANHYTWILDWQWWHAGLALPLNIGVYGIQLREGISLREAMMMSG